MKLTNLASLHQDMQRKHHTKAQFAFSLRGLAFDVIFTIDEVPFQLLVGVKYANFFFRVPVHRGYWADSLDDPTFYQLKDLLGLTPHGEKFTSFKFLAMLNEHVPTYVTGTEVQLHEYVSLLPLAERRQVDEVDKIYFVGWKHHLNDGCQARNFDKTFRMTGSQALADYCRKHNISSMWSDKPRDRQAFAFPNGYRRARKER